MAGEISADTSQRTELGRSIIGINVRNFQLNLGFFVESLTIFSKLVDRDGVVGIIKDLCAGVGVGTNCCRSIRKVVGLRASIGDDVKSIKTAFLAVVPSTR